MSGSINGVGSRSKVIGADVSKNLISYTTDNVIPSGWSEYTAARGRMIVGLPSGGTNEGTVGTAFTDQQDKSDLHNHTGPSHTHKTGVNYASGFINYRSSSVHGESGSFTATREIAKTTDISGSTDDSLTSASGTGNTGNTTLNTSDFLAYIQLMAIKKD